MVAPANPYEQKFTDFIRLVAETADDVVLTHHPQAIGDNCDEIVASLNRLADAVTQLGIVPRPQLK